MDLLSAEQRIKFLTESIENMHKWIKNSSGVSEGALKTYVEDIGRFLEEKRDLSFKVSRSKATCDFDRDMSILEAECYVESIKEMARVNENVAFGLSKFVLGGTIKPTDADVVSLYNETSSMLSSVFEIEERLRRVKSITKI